MVPWSHLHISLEATKLQFETKSSPRKVLLGLILTPNFKGSNFADGSKYGLRRFRGLDAILRGHVFRVLYCESRQTKLGDLKLFLQGISVTWFGFRLLVSQRGI